MIKIIISGTSDGFYPRYATDGKLDDAVSQNLLDRRRFLSREADRLDKEGYCFQVLDNSGILFHKILLLYDGFGRDGFMMASLFLPKNETLIGEEIKEALDSIVRDYKTRTINGMANFDLDWSFVKQKADELNKKVQNVTWKKLSSNNDVSCTALINGADDMVADYFQYPNPLHKGFAGFGLVFLSKAILDPSKESDDGYQGYKVLTTEDVDISNIEYQIVLNGLLQQDGSFEGTKKITKKELLKNGDIRIGTYSKPGFRSADVFIKDEDKISKDNLTITVTLPTLKQKRAIVEITVIDTSTGKPVPNYIINWKNVSPKTLNPQKQVDGTYIFSGESCDTKWSYAIDCGKSYEIYSYEIDVKDGAESQITNEVTPKPLWSIAYVLPSGDMTAYKTGISDDSIKQWIKHTKEYLELNGYDIEKKLEDAKSLKVTLYCKEHAVETFVHSEKHEKDYNSDEIVDTVPDVTHTEENASFPELKRDKYCLKLNDKSRNFPIFKSYRKKRDIEKEISDSLQYIKEQQKKWKDFCAQYENLPTKGKKQWENNVKQKKELLNFITRIIDLLEDFKAEEAETELSGFSGNFFDTAEGRPIHYKITDAIDRIKRHKSIPDVVVSPNDITYNDNEHQLECERSESPSTLEEIEFNKDRYVYSISNPIWQKEGTWNKQTNVVNKKLLTKYNVLRIAIPIAAILAFVLILVLFMGNGDTSIYKSYKENISLMLSKCDELSYNEQAGVITRYVGDAQFQKLDSLRNEVRLFVDEHTMYKDSLKLYELNMVYNEQKELREKDSICYNKCKQLLNTFPHNNSLLELPENIEHPALSREHYEELRVQYKQASDNWSANQDNLRKLCLSELGTAQNIKDYFDKFGKDEDLGKCLVNIARNESKESDERLIACDVYITYWPKGSSKNLIKGIKDKLSGIEIRDINLRKTDNDSKSQNNKENTTDSESLAKTDQGNLPNVEKTKLNSTGAIFNKLLWDNVKNNGKVLFDQYDVANQYQQRIKDLITRANNVGQSKYSKAYGTVSQMKMSDLKGKDKLYYLEIELSK